jgi:hypothetical protein
MWGAPLWGMTGILLMLITRPKIDTAMIKRFLTAWGAVFLLATLIYTGQLLIKVPSRSQFPGAAIGHTLTEEWHARYHRPLAIVGGSLWLGGTVAFYSEDRPVVFVELDAAKSEWVDAAALHLQGGILVWEAAQVEALPAHWRELFPQAEVQQIQSFNWVFRKDKPPFRLAWAIVPPQH